MTELHGTWTCTTDPLGEVPFDSMNAGNRMTFSADGSYSFQMGETSFSLDGTATLRERRGDALIVDIDYGEERTNAYHITLRGEDAMVLTEGGASGPVHFYTRDGGSRE